MDTELSTATKSERNILRSFFDLVSSAQQQDNTISGSKAVRDTKNKLKVALRNVPQRCTCAKGTWGGPCEVCQGSDRELVDLRNFFRVIRNAKKHDMTPTELQEFIKNTQDRIKSQPQR
jgi:hypothetical protein